MLYKRLPCSGAACDNQHRCGRREAILLHQGLDESRNVAAQVNPYLGLRPWRAGLISDSFQRAASGSRAENNFAPRCRRVGPCKRKDLPVGRCLPEVLLDGRHRSCRRFAGPEKRAGGLRDSFGFGRNLPRPRLDELAALLALHAERHDLVGTHPRGELILLPGEPTIARDVQGGARRVQRLAGSDLDEAVLVRVGVRGVGGKRRVAGRPEQRAHVADSVVDLAAEPL